MKQIPGVISLGGDEKNFNYGATPFCLPDTVSGFILGHWELLRQLRLKVFLKSNLLSPFVCFVCVPLFRQ